MSQSAAPFRHMLARPGSDMPTLAADPDWSFEPKLDGVRVFVIWDGTRLSLVTRTGRDITAQFPELPVKPPPDRLRPWCLDAELTSLNGLREVVGRINRRPPHPSMIGRRLAPALINPFDVLQVDGALVTELPLEVRRQLLFRLVDDELDDLAMLRVQAYLDGAVLLRVTRAELQEGVMAKRLSSPYLQGRRSHAWLKFKHRYELTLIVYGYTASTSSTRPLGALQVAALDGVTVRPVGEVGTGLSDRELIWFKARLDDGRFPLVRVSCIGRTPNGLREPVLLGRVDGSQMNDFTSAQYDQLDRLPNL